MRNINKQGEFIMDSRSFLNDKHFLMFLDQLSELKESLDNPKDVSKIKFVVNKTYNYYYNLLSQ